MTVDLTDGERERVINDLAAWKEELHMNDELTDEEWDDFIDEITSLSDEALVDRWRDNVGEWVLSRDDVYRRGGYDPGVDGDEVLDAEFEKLIDPDKTTSYGYIGGRPSVAA